ncbi:CYFA0S35e00738g1_1 [Cyberlindnera fabianii]|uniref:CYFA0S35e00738g1_1 n=1 Tax=Cyberlindnera fabianii TaxID=36022 RepID=A0A061BCH1_CYBFA|nr:CYFA0S35e00738g1_1 [Cyberlindnera fabianii]
MLTKSVITLGTLAALTHAQSVSLLTEVDFDNTLDAYYYFRYGAAGIALSEEGITVTGDFPSDSAACDVLAGAQIVYSADDGEDVLLTSNCYNVYHLNTEDAQEITWTSCVEFPFYQALCESGPIDSDTSSAIADTTTTESTTGIVSSIEISLGETSTSFETTVSGSETYVISTYTSYQSNIAYEYTTYCPLSDVTTEVSTPIDTGSADLPDYQVVEATLTTIVTVDDAGVETTLTEYIPITEDSTPSTTVVTITSCHENKCTIIPVTTGVTVITSIVNDVITEFTTYCPLSGEETSKATGAATAAASTVATPGAATVVETATSTATAAAGSSAAAGSTATGETNTGATVEAQHSSSSTTGATAAAISTFQDAGVKVIGSMSLGLIFAAFGLMI